MENLATVVATKLPYVEIPAWLHGEVGTLGLRDWTQEFEDGSQQKLSGWRFASLQHSESVKVAGSRPQPEIAGVVSPCST